ncbi:MAG: ATP-dependent DNA helicase [Defluviitaleaceae bacterium]|nr:ATP-dependent DNA helicase [Defluviitaleaceae bacterium]
METIKIPVRKIIDLIMRCGDIDSGFSDVSAMHKGAAIHRKIQKKAGENYQKEVSLKLRVQIEGINVVVQGRADGIITESNGTVIIDEIKTTTLPLDRIFIQHEQHLGQGKCYAYMYLQTLENPPELISVQLTYYQLESKEIRKHKWDFTIDELSDFFSDLMHKYGEWLRFEKEYKIMRDKAIMEMLFPFESYRKGQRELAVAFYRSIIAGKKLYACAPTGIGKTLSVLFPSIKAIGMGSALKLFYLTAKTVTRTVAEDAMMLMINKGLHIKSITLRAKEKTCINEECICSPSHCPYAKGHYDRVNDAIMDLIKNNDLITPHITEAYAKKHQVCPHELGLDASVWCDLVIGDYNHLFDPTVYLKRFFVDENNDYVFLIDEAHNLLERARDMYTACLNKGSFSSIRNRLKDKDGSSKQLRKAFRNINSYLVNLHKAHGEQKDHVSQVRNVEFSNLVTIASVTMGEWLSVKKNDNHELYKEILNLYFDVAKFIMISEIYDEHYTTIYEIRGADVYITLFCLDPSNVIAQKLAFGKSAILFSATLTPLPFYRGILGGNTDDPMIYLPSPFDGNRLLTVAHLGVSTRYKDRDNSYLPITETIYTAICHKKGNYFVFFPSYEYLHRVYELFCDNYPNVKTLVQQNTMTEDERAEFLADFDKDNQETLVGFAVLGGVFSEGIDLKGDRLIGAIIVSVGIPKISLRQDQIMDYYDKKNGQGYDYAYIYPGMNKVLQAAGRVIRTESDSGVVLLIDSRYRVAKYRGLLPSYWENVRLIQNTGELKILTKDFFTCADTT